VEKNRSAIHPGQFAQLQQELFEQGLGAERIAQQAGKLTPLLQSPHG
jgi:hypothetical protein